MLQALILLCCSAYVMGYGEPGADGHPVYQERASLFLINAVRIDPAGYKSLYMAGYTPSASGILMSYPTRYPIYWEPRLGQSSYSHSYEMATKNYFSHNSYDNTTFGKRLASFYSCSNGGIGENIAAGVASPVGVSNLWLCDSVNGACADDNTGAAGHRNNIMGGYKSAGIGFADGAVGPYRQYWTQDFGGACTGQTSPIYSATHIISGDKIKFAAIFYMNGTAPTSSSVVISGTTYPLTLDLGSSTMGSYAYTTNTSSTAACRPYYFTFAANNTVFRYPDTGSLATTTEGKCTDQYYSPSGASSGASSSSAAGLASALSVATTLIAGIVAVLVQ